MTTRLSDIVIPELFTSYIQQLTEQKSNLIASGAVVRDTVLDNDLAGGGKTFNNPSFKDLADDIENISSDDPAIKSTPKKIGTATEIQVRLSRNNSWGSMDLTSDLAGADPLSAISSRVADYWTRRQQVAFISTMKGVFAQNALATPVNATKDDMTYDISATNHSTATEFSMGALIDATLTMGDAMESLGMIFCHSIIYARMQKNNQIQLTPPSETLVNIPTFLGRTIIVDDHMPYAAGKAETWLFGAGSVRMGVGSPRVSTEVQRDPSSGNGSGEETLYNRNELIIHPVGHAYVGISPSGGPSNAATSNNLAAASSWNRVFTERKQINIARLITRES